MSVIPSDIKIYGSANMQESDSGTQGGAIDESVSVPFQDLTASQNNNLVIVSASGSDTTPKVSIYGRTNAGSLVSDSGTLDGQTPVAISQTYERLMKCIKDGSTDGDVAVMESGYERDNTAQDGAAATSSGDATITLDAGADGTDDYYNSYVLRLNGGTGDGQIRQIIDYVGSTKVASVNRDWNTVPDGTSEFLVSKGVVFEKSPNEVLTVRRPFYDVSADVGGGSSKDFYEKIFIKNENDTKALLGMNVIEYDDQTESYSADVTFDTETPVDGTGIATDRRTVPTGSWNFDDSNKTIGGSDLQPTGTVGVWLKLTLDAGAPATNTTFTVQTSGTST